ncbi:Zinc-binding dehydrogenase [Rhizoctonia solani]|uniref:Zinc-binding dehydrogenase n=1 Tax=Rhizoctonia solani TaxID=456999 RepID=A0A8H8NTI5_9AGAM|nr:Zinc-binding dehydrogenase [Rhizoctonia solani]QRW18345.1 Zinc-binding dehydrogenase [Rhizoctonia solani]
MAQHKALLLLEKYGELEVKTRLTPIPQGGQALVKVNAAAINPADWKAKNFPTVLGVDGAGIVEVVGPEVTNFKVGDRVFFQGLYDSSDETVFQEKAIVDTDIISKIPDNITEDEASTIPSATIAAWVGLFQKTGIEVPTSSPTANGKGVLILGGSSSVGQFGGWCFGVSISISYILFTDPELDQGIQLARIAGFSPIVTTASAQHADFLRSLGATRVFDRNVDTKAVQSAFPTPVSLVLDSISIAATQEFAFEVLTTPSPVPDAHLVLVLPPTDSLNEQNSGETIAVHTAYGSSHRFKDLTMPFWRNIEQWIKDGKFVPNRVQVVKGGLAALPEAIDLSRKGVSGVKVVIHPQE